MSDSPRTLLFFHASAELYGSDRTLLQLAQGLDRTRWRCVVALPREGPLVAKLRAAGATVEVGPLAIFGRATLRPRGFLRSASALPRSLRFARALVREHRPALVHTNTLVVLSGALAARAEGVAHVWHVHEILERPRWLARCLARLVQRLSTRAVCNSRATSAHLCSLAPGLASKTEVIENGVETPRDLPARAEARARLGLDPDATWIALVGRVNAWKGHALLLDAFSRLAATRPKLHLFFAGDAPPGQPQFLEQLERDIDAFGLRERVTRLPFHDEVGAIYAAADLVAVPSTLPEPFGLVAVEAMAASRPVVAARHGGLVEIVEHGTSGLLVTPNDPEELARALALLVDDPELARRFGAAARARQQEHFSLARYCAGFEALYTSIASTPAAVASHRKHEAAA